MGMQQMPVITEEDYLRCPACGERINHDMICYNCTPQVDEERDVQGKDHKPD